MELIAITGTIASGKSTYAKKMQRSGYPVIDADKIVHALLSPGSSAMRHVAAAFPQAVTKLGMDRKKLAEMVFEDEKKLRQLEEILHPEVRKEIASWAKKMRRRGHKKAFVEVPLLFESRMQNLFDGVVMVAASHPEIKRRAMAREGMTKEKLSKILARQWPQKRKMKQADQIFYNL